MQEKLTLRKARKPSLNVSDAQLAKDRARMSVGYMAQHYGVSKSTVYRALRKAGLISHEEQEPTQPE